MSNVPPVVDFTGNWADYCDQIYAIYLDTVAHGNLTFKGERVSCQYRPETNGKHYAFWHMMQEGKYGGSEDDRTPDFERCKRVAWISWVIQNAGRDPRIRVFRQADRYQNVSWVLWLHEERYAVILWKRKGHYLLKTAYTLRKNTEAAFMRDWTAAQARP